ncbi:MAG: hypothetical protein CMF74_12990 [Maricaulis sp.]|nr:hypothetical protein [Maricaulis sp.]MAL10562.1 hypothetical protein [Maricaulis sp.]HAQ36807.1 hypothetical protein [Alphaproteobacteria bacterium]
MAQADALSDSGRVDRLGVPLRDGALMSVAVSGTGPDLLLVHGWSAHAGFFDSIRTRLDQSFRVIAPDLRGHGQSAPGSAPLTIDQLADDMGVLAHALDLQDAVALGWSMGATVLWRHLAEHGSNRFSGLIVEDMSPRILNDHAWVLGMTNGLDAQSSKRATEIMRADWAAYASAFAPRMFARESLTRCGDIAAWAAREIAACDGAVMADLWTSMAAEDSRPFLTELKLPVRVIHGAMSEAYSPETSRFLVETLPDAELVTFTRSGHAPHLEEAERFADAVAEFARRVQPPGVHNPNNSEGSNP